MLARRFDAPCYPDPETRPANAEAEEPSGLYVPKRELKTKKLRPGLY